MGRAKLKMELITNEKTRNTTFAKRKKGLQKKLHELCTLCDVKACMVIYGPKQGDSSTEPDIWPGPDKVHEIINKYQLVDIDDRRKRNTGLSKFFEDQNKKIEEDVGKLCSKNAQMEYVTWDSRMDGFSEDQLGQVFNSLESKIKDVNARIDVIKGMQNIAERGVLEYIPYCYPNPYQVHGAYGNSMWKDAIKTEPISFANPLQHGRIPLGYTSDTGTIFCEQSELAYYPGEPMNPVNNFLCDSWRIIENQMLLNKEMEFRRQQEASMFSSSSTMSSLPPDFPSFMPGTSNQMNFHRNS